jgi:type IV secretion system protein VirB10
VSDKKDNAPAAETLAPLEGEAGIPSVSSPRRASVAIKAVMAVAILLLGLGFAIYATLHQVMASGKSEAAEDRKGPKAAATVMSGGHNFDPSKPPELANAPANSQAVVVPAIDTSEGVEADPIGLRGQDNSRSASKRSPLDAPALLSLAAAPDGRASAAPSLDADLPDSQLSTATPQDLSGARSSLNQYKQQLEGMLGNLQKITATSAAGPQSLTGSAPPPAPLGGQLTAGGTARVAAGHLGDMSLTLPRGTMFTCSLKTKIVSEQSGFVGCQVLRNVYSADGRVLLVDRGSHMDGEYTSRVKNGQSRIFVVWSRLRTPGGITVDLGSPATGPLGEAGVEGYVDNHWPERIGAALMLSLIEDAAKIAAAEAGSGSNSSTAIVLGDSADTTSNLSEKVLDAQINIPPTIYKLHAEVVGIYVAKDVDFSSVYELRTAAR